MIDKKSMVGRLSKELIANAIDATEIGDKESYTAEDVSRFKAAIARLKKGEDVEAIKAALAKGNESRNSVRKVQQQAQQRIAAATEVIEGETLASIAAYTGRRARQVAGVIPPIFLNQVATALEAELRGGAGLAEILEASESVLEGEFESRVQLYLDSEPASDRKQLPSSTPDSGAS